MCVIPEYKNYVGRCNAMALNTVKQCIFFQTRIMKFIGKNSTLNFLVVMCVTLEYKKSCRQMQCNGLT